MLALRHDVNQIIRAYYSLNYKLLFLIFSDQGNIMRSGNKAVKRKVIYRYLLPRTSKEEN